MNHQKAKRGADWPWQRDHESSRPVLVAEIIRDEALQVRVKPLPSLAKKYADEMQCGQQFPPVSIADVGGKLYLLDGWHRIDAAAERLGHTSVEAVVRKMKWAEALGEASESNATHGAGLTNADKRKKLDMHIKAGRHKKGGEIVQSYRDLVKHLGIKLGSLHRWMREDHPETFKRMQKGYSQERDAEPPELPDTDPENLRRALQALQDALNYCDKLRDPEKRQDVIDTALEVVEKMKLKEHHEFEW